MKYIVYIDLLHFYYELITNFYFIELFQFDSLEFTRFSPLYQVTN